MHTNSSYQADSSITTWYQQFVCLLIYAMTETWFGITFVVLTVSQFAKNPSSEYVSAIKRIFWYLKKYPSLEIIYTKNKQLLLYGYVDSN